MHHLVAVPLTRRPAHVREHGDGNPREGRELDGEELGKGERGKREVPEKPQPPDGVPRKVDVERRVRQQREKDAVPAACPTAAVRVNGPARLPRAPPRRVARGGAGRGATRRLRRWRRP